MRNDGNGWKSGETRKRIIEGTYGAGVPILEARADLNVQITEKHVAQGLKNRLKGSVAKGCTISCAFGDATGMEALILRTVAYVPMMVKGKLKVFRYILSAEARRYTIANDLGKKLIGTVVTLKAPTKGNTATAGAARSAKYRHPDYQRRKLARMDRLGIKAKTYQPSVLTSIRMATARRAAGFVGQSAAA